jgi:hypothetical protein
MKRKLANGKWVPAKADGKRPATESPVEPEEGLVSNLDVDGIVALMQHCFSCGFVEGPMRLRQVMLAGTDNIAEKYMKLLVSDAVLDSFDTDVFWLLHLSELIEFSAVAVARPERAAQFIKNAVLLQKSRSTGTDTDSQLIVSMGADILLYLFDSAFPLKQFSTPKTLVTTTSETDMRDVLFKVIAPTIEAGGVGALEEVDLYLIIEVLNILSIASNENGRHEFCTLLLRPLLVSAFVVCTQKNLAQCNYLMSHVLPHAVIDKCVNQLVWHQSGDHVATPLPYLAGKNMKGKICQSFLRLLFENKACLKNSGFAQFMSSTINLLSTALCAAVTDTNVEKFCSALLLGQLLWESFSTVNAKYLELLSLSAHNAEVTLDVIKFQCTIDGLIVKHGQSAAVTDMSEWLSFLFESITSSEVDRDLSKLQFVCLSVCEIVDQLHEIATRSFIKFTRTAGKVKSDASDVISALQSLCRTHLRYLESRVSDNVFATTGIVGDSADRALEEERSLQAARNVGMTNDRVLYWTQNLRRTQCLPLAVSQLCTLHGVRGVLHAFLLVCDDSLSTSVENALEIQVGCKAIVNAMSKRVPPLCTDDETKCFLALINSKIGRAENAKERQTSGSHSVKFQEDFKGMLLSLAPPLPPTSTEILTKLSTLACSCITKYETPEAACSAGPSPENVEGFSTSLSVLAVENLTLRWRESINSLFISTVSVDSMSSMSAQSSASKPDCATEQFLCSSSAVVSILLFELVSVLNLHDVDFLPNDALLWVRLFTELISVSSSVEWIMIALASNCVSILLDCLSEPTTLDLQSLRLDRRLWCIAVVFSSIADSVSRCSTFF